MGRMGEDGEDGVIYRSVLSNKGTDRELTQTSPSSREGGGSHPWSIGAMGSSGIQVVHIPADPIPILVPELSIAPIDHGCDPPPHRHPNAEEISLSPDPAIWCQIAGSGDKGIWGQEIRKSGVRRLLVSAGECW